MSNDFDRLEFTPRRHVGEWGMHWVWSMADHRISKFWSHDALLYARSFDATPGIHANQTTHVLSAWIGTWIGNPEAL